MDQNQEPDVLDDPCPLLLVDDVEHEVETEMEMGMLTMRTTMSWNTDDDYVYKRAYGHDCGYDDDGYEMHGDGYEMHDVDDGGDGHTENDTANPMNRSSLMIRMVGYDENGPLFSWLQQFVMLTNVQLHFSYHVLDQWLICACCLLSIQFFQHVFFRLAFSELMFVDLAFLPLIGFVFWPLEQKESKRCKKLSTKDHNKFKCK